RSKAPPPYPSASPSRLASSATPSSSRPSTSSFAQSTIPDASTPTFLRLCRGAACCAPVGRHVLNSQTFNLLKLSLYLVDDPNLLQRLQIFHHQVQRHGSILRRRRIAYFLRVPLPICKIQNLIRVLFSRSPQSLITQQLRRCHSRRLRMLRKVVVSKHGQRPFVLALSSKSKLAIRTLPILNPAWRNNMMKCRVRIT